MKKIIALVTAAALTAGLSACTPAEERTCVINGQVEDGSDCDSFDFDVDTKKKKKKSGSFYKKSSTTKKSGSTGRRR